MDNALLGVVIGSVISLVGNIFQHWPSASKEARQWQRQQEADETGWHHKNLHEQSRGVRDAYESAIVGLGAVISVFPEERERLTPESPRFELVRDAYRAVSQIYLRHHSPEFEERLDNFLASPNYYAAPLRDYIISWTKQNVISTCFRR